MANSLHLVVPCYNERTRLAVDQIGLLTADDRVSLVLVDDGSTDRTLDLLRSIERDTCRVTVIALPRNGGKGEAVRTGLLSSLAANPSWIGYVDADMATPASEILRLLDVAASQALYRCGDRVAVALLGRDVQRSAFRHYTGRVFATSASVVLVQGGLRHPVRREAVPAHERVRSVDRRTVPQPVGVRRGTARPIGVSRRGAVAVLGGATARLARRRRRRDERFPNRSERRRSCCRSGVIFAAPDDEGDRATASPAADDRRHRAVRDRPHVAAGSTGDGARRSDRRVVLVAGAGTGIIKYDPVYHGPLRFYLEGFVLDHFGITPGWTRADRGTRRHRGDDRDRNVAAFVGTLRRTLRCTPVHHQPDHPDRHANRARGLADRSGLAGAAAGDRERVEGATPTHIVGAGALLAVSFTLKETTFIFGLAGACFFVGLAVVALVRPTGQARSFFQRLRGVGTLPWMWSTIVFIAILMVVFTSGFRYGAGFTSGLVDGVKYWWSQHDVGRGSQRSFFYGTIYAGYEWLLLAVAAVGAIVTVRRRSVVGAWFATMAIGQFALYSLGRREVRVAGAAPVDPGRPACRSRSTSRVRSAAATSRIRRVETMAARRLDCAAGAVDRGRRSQAGHHRRRGSTRAVGDGPDVGQRARLDRSDGVGAQPRDARPDPDRRT